MMRQYQDRGTEPETTNTAIWRYRGSSEAPQPGLGPSSLLRMDGTLCILARVSTSSLLYLIQHVQL